MVVTLIDHMRGLPPCVVCGSTVVKVRDNLKIDWINGEWRGEWICENGHRNIFK
jgi:hypothetical protein